MAKLDVLTKGAVELCEVVFVFSNLANNIHCLLHKDLADDLEDFVLLESLSENVKRKVFGVDDTFDEIGMRSSQSSMMDVEFDVVALLL